MTDETLTAFRDIADDLLGKDRDWEWIGPHASQRMFGITQKRADGYAKRHGGTARKMEHPLTGFAPFRRKEKIILTRFPMHWSASYRTTTGDPCPKTAALFGTHILDTGFAPSVDAEEVLDHMTKLHPSRDVSVVTRPSAWDKKAGRI